MGYLQAPASDLGYTSLVVPAPITLPSGQCLEDFMPIAGVPKLRPVYCALLEGVVVVIKLGCSRDIEREVIWLRASESGFYTLSSSLCLIMGCLVESCLCVVRPYKLHMSWDWLLCRIAICLCTGVLLETFHRQGRVASTVGDWRTAP